MRKLTGAFFQSLDGVIQAPGGPTEDPTGGFTHGGWMAPVFDEVVNEEIGKLFTPPYALLLGRRTYDIFAAYWPYAEGENAEMGRALTAAEKYVLTHGDQPLEWENSHRLKTVDDVSALKRTDGPDLLIQGSSTIYAPLLAAGLIDRLVVMTFPILLGSGKRPFGDGNAAQTLKLVEHKVGDRAIVAVYEPGGAVETGSFGQIESAREDARQGRMREGGW